MNPFIKKLQHRASHNDNVVLVDIASAKQILASELLQSAYDVAGKLLSLGAKRGDFIVVTMSASYEYYSLLYGCFISGIIPSLIDPKQSKKNLVTCIDELKPVLWISNQDIPEFKTTTMNELYKAPASPVFNDKPALDSACMLLYTTGTTGIPKGVPWTLEQLESQAMELKHFHKQVNCEFVLFPYLALACIYNDKKAIIPNTRTTQPNLMSIESIFFQMKTYGSDYIFASPAFWIRLTQYCQRTQHQLDFIKIISTAGASLNLVMLQRLSDTMTCGEIYIPYASTEALLPVTQIEFKDFKALSLEKTLYNKGIPLGKPCQGINVAVIESNNDSAYPKRLNSNTIGELIVSGQRITKKYFRRKDITQSSKVNLENSTEIWHKMGDLGYIDDTGMVWLMSRKKYSFESIHGLFCPDAIEQCLNIHGNCLSSAVVYHKERDIVSLIIPQQEHQQVKQESLKLKLKEIGYPNSQILFYPSLLPSDSRHNSKVNREALEQWIEDNELYEKYKDLA
ncbi:MULTISPECIES: AMP-binding protein [unclassified Agarivorans]|uniref:AMP-binding protein n=1 Tax=unclassified Agarivorans TaxID=2636026 RepID=UPI003D7E4136